MRNILKYLFLIFCPTIGYFITIWSRLSGISFVCVSSSGMSDSFLPDGLKLARLFCPWNSSGKNTEVGCHSLLQRIFPNPGIKPGSLALQVDSSQSEPSGKFY